MRNIQSLHKAFIPITPQGDGNLKTQCASVVALAAQLSFQLPRKGTETQLTRQFQSLGRQVFHSNYPARGRKPSHICYSHSAKPKLSNPLPRKGIRLTRSHPFKCVGILRDLTHTFPQAIAGPEPCLSVLSQTRDRRIVGFDMTSQGRGAIEIAWQLLGWAVG